MSKSTGRNLINLAKNSSVKKHTNDGFCNDLRCKRQSFDGDKMKTKKKKVALEVSQKENKSSNGDSAVSEEFNGKCQMVFGKVATLQNVLEVRQHLLQEVEVGNIQESDVIMIMQKWRQQKRRKAYEERKEKVISMEGTLEDVKHTVHNLVRNRKLKRRDAGEIIRRWKNTERRRLKRQVTKQVNRACFNCRQVGHVLADCPNRGDDEQAVGNISSTCTDGICFKCGSTEHNVRMCPRKHVKGFPFAACFVCGQQGHLSRDCVKNANGIYPDGGCCNVCGSIKHLKRDCPELAAQKQKKGHHNITVRMMSAMSSADEDYVPENETSMMEMEMRPKKKIVKF